ncbi:hypothetical protein HMPREF0860_2570 [Treponema socranskii subsp. socranskii VPI DR56BR1116 = ATCC 35536]|uniref:Uncharacterized protein n=1 Tax=Treponema socranskii subsp. socranskii VPI DR56BR1116 = ATCC 35536 TaxID=1125725 RepID=U2N0Y2_TRESO|nr:hypothetical protein HMPREF1325_0316 [Treponema socranskii subsp. socranskii VPI DR56BR1116 = ATCC 35536]ERK05079.1 hypothetical protein HMPREF0860_2570 [Treponema socranskii subsp. socranskii VPI DR56BR1116 = ATCC 35536]
MVVRAASVPCVEQSFPRRTITQNQFEKRVKMIRFQRIFTSVSKFDINLLKILPKVKKNRLQFVLPKNHPFFNLLYYKELIWCCKSNEILS